MFRTGFVVVLLCCGVCWSAAPAHAQGGGEALRVTVSQNNDGSRTTYETDPASRKATAITTSKDGKLLSTIRYVLDDVGRYQSGEVFNAKEQLQFKTLYKYDPSGRLSEETRLNKEDAVQMKLVYAYDETGKPGGYAVYDAAGNLLGQTKAAAPAASHGAKPRRNLAR